MVSYDRDRISSTILVKKSLLFSHPSASQRGQSAEQFRQSPRSNLEVEEARSVP